MNMKFQVTVKSNTAPPEYSTALFNGRLRGTFLEGSLKWIGEAAEVRGENGVEKLKLPKETTVKLLSFCPAVYSPSPICLKVPMTAMSFLPGCLEPAIIAVSMAIDRPQAIGDAPAGPERSGGWRPRTPAVGSP
jgi:hypothetical protein